MAGLTGETGERGGASCGVCVTIGFPCEELTDTTRPNMMQIKTILNRIQKHSAQGQRQTPEHDDVCLVPGAVGEADELIGGGRGVSDVVGPGVWSGGDGRELGSGPP